MKPTEKDYEKFNKLLKFFVRQWEENAKYEGNKDGKACYGRTWEGRGWDKFTNFGFSKDLVDYDIDALKLEDMEKKIHFGFGSGIYWEKPGSNLLAVGWINIVPTFNGKKITKLETVIVKTPKDNQNCKIFLEFKEKYNKKFNQKYCAIEVNNSSILRKDSDKLFDNFIFIAREYKDFVNRKK